MSRSLVRVSALALAAATAVAVAACSPPSGESDSSSSSSGATDAATATSAADFGGMDKLVEAAKKEGTLNVIALPPDWAGYGAIIEAFKTKYGLEVVSDQPDASSADEISTAQRLKGQSKAPDVFDLGPAVALANTAMFAPYKVESFDAIPERFKDPKGTWVNDYGGIMAVGYDSAKVPEVTSLADLQKPAYRGKVALNGNPTEAGAAFAGVQMVAIAQGGTPEDPAKGVQWFADLKKAGNFLPVDPTPATIESGQTPVVFDWSYNHVGTATKLPSWKQFVPENAALASFYVQAVNKDAPHPAAARLWQEYLFSPDGQNGWLRGGATPVLLDQMTKDGTVDAAAAAKLPKVTGEPVVPTTEQTDAAKAVLATTWANAVG
ncbi:MAG TPA: ABC transporter substrate-binding protein [Dermatophilaceae bacterium]|nr:ABC transporter substrate-binding protein [Dermatophilaceae bacterium]